MEFERERPMSGVPVVRADWEWQAGSGSFGEQLWDGHLVSQRCVGVLRRVRVAVTELNSEQVT